MKLFTNLRTLTSAAMTQGSSQLGYDPANVMTTSLTRQFRSVDGSPCKILVGFGAARVRGILLHDINAEAPMVKFLNSSFSTLADVLPQGGSNAFGRRRLIAATDCYPSYAEIFFNNPAPAVASTLTYKTYVQQIAAGKFNYRRIAAPNIAIAAGDKVIFTQRSSSSNPELAGGCEVDFVSANDSGRSYGLVDQFGVAMHFAPPAANGAFVTRLINLPGSVVGKTITSFNLVNEAETNGQYVVEYKTIAILDSSNTIKYGVWSIGQPQMNVDAYSQGVVETSVAGQGAPMNGDAYWRLGAVYVLGDSLQVVPAPNKGFGLVYKHAQQQTDLPNALSAVTETGVSRHEMTFDFSRCNAQDLSTIAQETRKGVCVIDMENPLMPDQVWPVVCQDALQQSQIVSVRRENIGAKKFVEVA